MTTIEPFEFASAQRIVFGCGTLNKLPELVQSFGRRLLLVTGATSARAEPVIQVLATAGFELTSVPVEREPTVEDAARGALAARDFGAEWVLGFGGGSAIDAGKAMAALATNPGDPLDYLEVVGKGQPLRSRPLPYVAIPTTAGTGAEVTKNAVLDVGSAGVKVSLRSNAMLPKLALVDPELTLTVPPAVTASTGFDALSQVLEPYVSNKANPVCDGFCVDGLRRSARSLRRAFHDGADRAAREDLALTSLYGGLALANSKLGAVHGFAGPLGGMYSAAHGALCAALLAPVMHVNVRALASRAPAHPALRRYDEIARILTNDPGACADDGVGWVRDLARELQIPGLREYGVEPAAFEQIAGKAAAASSMQGNPIRLTPGELREVLEAAL